MMRQDNPWIASGLGQAGSGFDFWSIAKLLLMGYGAYHLIRSTVSGVKGLIRKAAQPEVIPVRESAEMPKHEGG